MTVTDQRLDLEHYFPYLVNRVGFALVARYQKSLDPYGLSIEMWRVLAALSSRGELRQVDIARMTSIDASTLSRLVARIVRLGLVTRTRSKSSQREVAVRLSAKGRMVVGRLIPIARQLEREAIAGLTSRQQAEARDVLRTMYANLAAADDSLCGRNDRRASNSSRPAIP
jgi:DNA-binding MarR family transcriptional regulator